MLMQTFKNFWKKLKSILQWKGVFEKNWSQFYNEREFGKETC